MSKKLPGAIVKPSPSITAQPKLVPTMPHARSGCAGDTVRPVYAGPAGSASTRTMLSKGKNAGWSPSFSTRMVHVKFWSVVTVAGLCVFVAVRSGPLWQSGSSRSVKPSPSLSMPSSQVASPGGPSIGIRVLSIVQMTFSPAATLTVYTGGSPDGPEGVNSVSSSSST